MSSLVERLRVRSERRPLYTLDESDDDLPPRGGAGKGKDRQDDAPAERIEREDAVKLIGPCFSVPFAAISLRLSGS
jgi:chromodomain-helicase-DNA-binding protein 4